MLLILGDSTMTDFGTDIVADPWGHCELADHVSLAAFR